MAKYGTSSLFFPFLSPFLPFFHFPSIHSFILSYFIISFFSSFFATLYFKQNRFGPGTKESVKISSGLLTRVNWDKFSFVVFDSPDFENTFEKRLFRLSQFVGDSHPFVRLAQYKVCNNGLSRILLWIIIVIIIIWLRIIVYYHFYYFYCGFDWWYKLQKCLMKLNLVVEKESFFEDLILCTSMDIQILFTNIRYSFLFFLFYFLKTINNEIGNERGVC